MKDIREILSENKKVQEICNSYNKLTSRINFPSLHSKISFIIFLLTTLVLFYISVDARYNQYNTWKENPAHFFYEDTPMMTTLDAYKYTRHAKEINAGEYIPAGDDVRIFYPEGVGYYDPAPLLSVILAKLHNITKIDYYHIAINMVPWLSSIFILVVCAYFYIIGYPALGVIVGLLTTFAPVFYGRTSIGRFDTDGGNMFFLFLGSLIILIATMRKKQISLYICSGLLGLTILAFQHFYNHILFNLVYFLVFIFTLYVYNHKLKNILIAGVIYIVTSNPLVFVNSLGSLLGSLAVYIPFMPNAMEATSPIPWVYNTIGEAAAESFDGIVAFILKNKFLFFMGLLGGILFFIANIKKMLPTLPILAMGFVVFVSAGRFAMYLAPFVAAGLGYIIYIVSHYIFENIAKKYIKLESYIKTFVPFLLIILMTFGIIKAGFTNYGMIPAASINTGIYKLIDNMKDRLPENATIYTWWDYGLAITDITGFPVYHSGMSQSTPKTWMVARSLSGSQEDLYNISSYIATGGYEEVDKMFKDNKTIDEVLNIMTSYNKGPQDEEIYILFTYDMIQKYGAISYIAGKQDGVPTLNCIPSGQETLQCGNGINMNITTGEMDLGGNQKLQLAKLSIFENGKQAFSQIYSTAPGHSIMIYASSGRITAYLLSPELATSSFIQMFLMQQVNTKYFTKIIESYPFGIVYKVNKK